MRNYYKEGNITQESIELCRKTWIQYLRKPHIKKHKGFLESRHTRSKRCCLGHACFVLGLKRDTDFDGDVAYWNDNPGSYHPIQRYNNSSFTKLPPRASAQLNIDVNGTFHKPIKLNVHPYDMEYTCLSSVNDNTNLTLPQIADIIEEQLKAGNIKESKYVKFSK